MSKNAIVIGISSAIGAAIAKALQRNNVSVLGSYRSRQHLDNSFADISLELDFNSEHSIDDFVRQVKDRVFCWDYLVICSGTMEPIGRFEDIDIEQWVASVGVNLLSPLRLLNGLLAQRQKATDVRPTVLTLAGGGVNGAPVNYSAYTLAKIGLIKMTELLAAEMPDVNFVNMGPGWVDTPIHRQTLAAGADAGQAFQQTQQRLKENAFVPMEKVVNSAMLLLDDMQNSYSGRNFSAADDPLGTAPLREALQDNPDMYKLRRHNNEWQ